MGNSIILRAKSKKLEEEYRKTGKGLFLRKNYNVFIWGIESWGEDCEFNQLQKFYEINLSPLRMFNFGGLGIHTEEIDGWKDWELSKVSKQEEINQINSEYQEKLEEAIKKDKLDHKNNWVNTQLVKQVIHELISKMKEKPIKFNQLDSYFYTSETFEMHRQNHKKNRYYILDDFEHIIDFANFIESKNEDKISFYTIG